MKKKHFLTPKKTFQREVDFKLYAQSGKFELLKDVELGFFCIYNGKSFTYYPNASEARMIFHQLTR